MTIIIIRKDTRRVDSSLHRLIRRRCLENVSEILPADRAVGVSQGYGLAYFLANLLYREDKADGIVEVHHRSAPELSRSDQFYELIILYELPLPLLGVLYPLLSRSDRVYLSDCHSW